MACVRKTAHDCNCSEELVALLMRFSAEELRQLLAAPFDAVFDSLEEALERRARNRPWGT